MLAESTTCVAALLRSPPMVLQNDLPLLLSSAAALPVSWQCSLIPVYRQSPQCGERSNAAFSNQSAAKLPSHAPHGSKARLRVVSNSRGSWRSHVHRTYTAQRVQSFKLQTANVRGQGARPLAFLWGFQRGYSLWKENTPFVSRPPANRGTKSSSAFTLQKPTAQCADNKELLC